MNDYDAPPEVAVIVRQRLIEKGKGIVALCLERKKNLCMKGFIDCQVEKGGDYLQVVEAMVEYIRKELPLAHTTSARALLLDLEKYALAQLANVRAVEEVAL